MLDIRVVEAIPSLAFIVSRVIRLVSAAEVVAGVRM
jgi:hypothetical protein